MKPTTLNIILIIATGILFLIISIVIILNRNSSEMTSISIKSLLIPVLAGTGILVLEFLKPVEHFQKDLHIGVSSEPEIMGTLSTKHDFKIKEGIFEYQSLMFQVKQEKLKYKDTESMVQALILLFLSNRYSTHWYVESDTQEWFFETSSSITGQKDGAEEHPKEIKISDYKNSNTFLEKYPLEKSFYVPRTANLELGKLSDLITISSDYIDISISFIGGNQASIPHSGGGTADHFRTKLNLPLDETYRIDFNSITLRFEAKPIWYKRWAPNTAKEMEWAHDLFEYLNTRIGWENYLATTY